MAKGAVPHDGDGTYKTKSGIQVVCNSANHFREGGQGDIYRIGSYPLLPGKSVLAKILKPAFRNNTYLKVAEDLANTPHPADLVAPIETLYGVRNMLAGFLMEELVSQYVPVACMEESGFRAKPLSFKLLVVKNGWLLLEALHQAGFIVGDLNDTGIFFHRDTGAVKWLDSDSLNFGTHHNSVFKPEFLDPNIPPSSTNILFSKANDYYAWAVIAFKIIFGMKIYGGRHDSLPMSQRRKRKITVLHDSMKGVWVKSPVKLKDIDPQLVAYFKQTFETAIRSPFPIDLVDPTLKPVTAPPPTPRPVIITPPLPPRPTIFVPSTPFVPKTPPVAPVATSWQITCRAYDLQREYFAKSAATYFHDAIIDSGKTRFVYTDSNRGKTFHQFESYEVETGGSVKDTHFFLMGSRRVIVAKKNSDGRTASLTVCGPGTTMGPDYIRTTVFQIDGKPQVACSATDYFTIDPADNRLTVNGFTKIGGPVNPYNSKIAASSYGEVIVYNGDINSAMLYYQTKEKPMNILQVPTLQGSLVKLDISFSATHLVVSRVERRRGKNYLGVWLFAKAPLKLVGSYMDEIKADNKYLENVWDTCVATDKVYVLTEAGLVFFLNKKGILNPEILFEAKQPLTTPSHLLSNQQNVGIWNNEVIGWTRLM